jgi:hypothetical protein
VAGSVLLSAISALAAPASTLPQDLTERVPLRFEPVSDRQWMARGLGFGIALFDRATVFPVGGRAVQLSFPDSNPQAEFEGARKAPAPSNYFSSAGFRSADAYLELRRRGVYPGVDVRYYGQGSRLEYDFELAAGADPAPIRIRFDGADSVRLTGRGELLITAAGHELTQRAPAVYQRSAAGGLVRVASSYFPEDGGSYSIRLGQYDPAEPVVIDPEVLFTAYLAGSGAEAPLSIGRDAAGNLYIAGYTHSSDFPLVGEAYSGFALTPNRQVFTTKLNPFAANPGDVISYSGFFGGDFGDLLRAMAVDEQGVLYLTGVTDDFFFPDTENAFLRENGNVRRVFFSVLDTKLPGKSGLLYSTFFGGKTMDEPTAIAIHNGKGYITGYTTSLDYPVKDPIMGTYVGGIDVFVAEFDPSKSGAASLVHSTYLGGFTQDIPRSIDVDAQGKVYIAGYTYSADFPTTPGSHKPFYSGGADAFMAKLDLDGQKVEYSTFLGGSTIDQAWKVLVDDRNGLVALGGFTLSNDFPVTANAMQAAQAGNGDAFLTILDLEAEDFTRSLVYSTYYGGNDGEVTYDMRLGPTGAYYLAGYTLSRNLPVRDAIRPVSAGASTDGFVAVIDPNAPPASALQFGSYITGGGYQIASTIEVDSAGRVYVAGEAFGNVFEPGQAAPPDGSATNVFLLVFRPNIPVARQTALEGLRGAESRRR